jgi:spore coat polysaccharide biosynthesis predicted glycosyltransferase SpsG
MKKILFRCDSSRHKGTGHVTRSFALAEIFALNGWEVTFLGEYDDPEWIPGFLNKIEGIKIEKPTKTIQQNNDYEVIVFDSYCFESGEVDTLRKAAKLIVSIVDEISPRIIADIYVSTLPMQYLPQFSDRSNCLFGPEYALIRREILLKNYKNRSMHTALNQKNTIGLFSGGSAKRKFLEIILNQLIPNLKGWNFKIFSESIDLKDSVKQGVKLEFIPPKPDFYNELDDVNLIISTASVSSWEFISMEIPLAIYGIFQNQKLTYEFLVKSGYAEGLGFTENYKQFNLSEINLRKAIENLSNDELRKNRIQKIIDGNGPIRVYDEVIKMI